MNGDPSCYFCPGVETTDHLFFMCPVAVVVWGIVGLCVGTNDFPRNISQYKNWIRGKLPGGDMVYTFGFAAICWAIWKCRNRACFDKKIIKNLAEILIHACAFMSYWAGLHNTDFQEKPMDGVKVVLACAHKVLAQPQRSSLRILPASTDDQDEEEE